MKYKKFSLFNNDAVLSLKTTDSSIDGIALKEGTNKTVPYITRSDSNNGVAKFVSIDNYDYGSDEGSTITIGLDTQTAFYQPHRFVTGQNIQVASADELNRDTALYLIVMLRSQMTAKLNWGGNGATLTRLKRLDALLPVDDDETPDFEYMKTHSENIEKKLLLRYSKYAERRLTELSEPIEIPALSKMKYCLFRLSDLFECVRGTERNMFELSEGDVPLVSARNTNNDVKGFVTTEKKTIQGNCIVLNNDGDGGAGLAYYQPHEFALDSHVTALIPKENIDMYALLFIAECLSGLHGFFGHGLSISNKRMKNLSVILPVNNGTPDYEYMSQYVKNIMIRKYRQYLEYKKDD